MANNLQVRATTSAPAKTASVFDDYESFKSAFEMAKALSRTSLIPKHFQGKPEDCLIALEYSRRLDIAPTAIMPHLFSVYGTPSMSAQLAIALVNRSGRFSRIKWAEGTDGTVVFKGLKGEKIEMPNLWAQASFRELSSGDEISSPRVDLRMALVNGWLTKGEDKGVVSMWQRMPQTMLRYRSASMLINTTCPELKMGIDVAEDVADNVSVQATATVQSLEPEGDTSPAPALTVETDEETNVASAVDEIIKHMS